MSLIIHCCCIFRVSIISFFCCCLATDDGAMFFDEKVVDALEYQGPISTTSSVVRGLVAFADVTSGKLAVS